MCHFIQFCLFSQSYLYIFNNYLYIIIFIYILFHFIFYFPCFFCILLIYLLYQLHKVISSLPPDFLQCTCHDITPHTLNRALESPLPLALSFSPRTAFAGHAALTHTTLALLSLRSLALLRSSALLLSLDSRVTFGAEQSNCHKVRAVTVIACHMLQALPC